MTNLNQAIVFLDVDDTLIRSVGQKQIPMPNVIARVRDLYKSGATLYLWSSGGAEYAKQSAAKLGIAECFVAFLPKPTIIIDDQPVNEWRYCKHEFPISL